MSKSDIQCPYCGADQEICHDDGYINGKKLTQFRAVSGNLNALFAAKQRKSKVFKLKEIPILPKWRKTDE